MENQTNNNHTSREKMIDLINKKYPKLNAVGANEFYGSDNPMIWLKGTENGVEAKNGLPLINYYSTDYSEKNYQMGIHKELVKLFDDNNWYGEFHDAGTLMVAFN